MVLISNSNSDAKRVESDDPVPEDVFTLPTDNLNKSKCVDLLIYCMGLLQI